MRKQRNSIKSAARVALEQKFAKFLTADTMRRIKSGEMKVLDGGHGIKKEITGSGGKIQLLTVDTVRKVGVSDFHQAKLNTGVNQIVERIRLAYGKDVVGNSPTETTVHYSHKLDNTVDKAFANADLIVRQDNKTVFRAPVASIMAEQLEDGSNGQTGFDLENMQLVKEGVEVSIELEFPELQSVEDSTNKHFVWVSLDGQYTSVN